MESILIQKNFSRARVPRDVTLIEGDFTQVEACVAPLNFDRNSFKVAIFIGTLTDQVVTGTRQAMAIIQQTRQFDHIIVGGWTTILLNVQWLKAAGFNVDCRSVENVDGNQNGLKQFHLTWMSAQDRRYHLEKRSFARSENQKFDGLDLSFSANPLRDIKLFQAEDFAGFIQIDMSWSYLKTEEVAEYFDIVSKIPATNINIIVSGHEVAYSDIVETCSPYVKLSLFKREDTANNFELPPFSLPEAKNWRVHEPNPHRRQHTIP